ncbi:MAG TPA: DUF1801 domain-containing protein [Chloroflexota bacterium]|nr:DUF1801 domain-containing protein [Chloroflexota bacterium]
MTKTELVTFEELLQIAAETQKPILIRLREIIFSIHPQACEVVRLGDRAATYGLGPKKMSEGYVYILPYTAWVNLGFYRGVDLHDPDGLLEGTGKKLRHVKIRTVAEADNPSIYTLIQAALEERKQAISQ